MEQWQIWLIVALILFLFEIFTSGFALACVSIGAVAGGIAALLSASVIIQLTAFIVVALASLLLLRPVVIARISKNDKVKTNAEAIIGRTAIVTQEIKAPLYDGRVQVDGDDWKAHAADNQEIKRGEVVTIVGIDSIIVTVKRQS